LSSFHDDGGVPVPLTIESLMLDVGRALAPLEQRLRDGEIALLFAEIGLPSSGAVLGVQAVGDAAGQAASALGDLPEALADLATAVEAGDGLRIAAAVGETAPILAAFQGAVEAVAGAVRAAAAQAGPGRAEVEAFAAELAQRLFGYALATYLEQAKPLAGHLLKFLGVLESTPLAATPATPAHVRRVFHLDRVNALLDDPVVTLTELYGWGTPDFDWRLVLRRLSVFLDSVAPFAFVQPGPPPFLRVVAVDIGITDDLTPGVQAVLRIATAQGAQLSVPIGGTLALIARADAALEEEAALQLLPPARLRVVTPASEVRGAVRFGLQAPPSDTDPPVVAVGTAGGSRIQARTVRVSVGADLDWNAADGHADGAFVIEATVEGGTVVLSLAGADGFLRSILPEGPIELNADVRLEWSSATGWHFHACTGLALDVPVFFRAGPATVSSLHLGLHTDGPGVGLELSCSVSAELGPASLAVERTGADVLLSAPSGGGNLGALDLTVAFRPPSGVGLVVEAGPAGGGGFLGFDPGRGEYAGAVELQLGKIGVKAVGVLSAGPGDWSLLLLLYAQIPRIQLGFGFTLEGIGGLIGVQRGVDLPQLIAGMRNGAFDDVLFPPDPVGDAPRILGRLGTLFPVRSGALTIGPMADVHWGKPLILTARLAVLLQLDNALGSAGGPLALARVVLIGQVRVAVGPTEEDPYARVVLLIVDVSGFWDLADRRYGFVAALRDSTVAGIDITGGLGVWGEYGDRPRFLLAAGGFNPRFQDVPAQLRGALDRLGASFSVGRFALVLAGYFALTPATIQAGLNLRATATIGSVGLAGDIGVDVLIYRRPRTRFIADFHVIVEVSYRGHTLAGVKVTGTIEGPSRWHLAGKATFSILWWDISVPFDESWGTPAPLLTELADVAALLAAELAKPENWSAQLPAGAGALVTLAPRRGDPAPRAHPLGAFVFAQQVAPLGLTLEKFGDSAVAGPARFDIESVTVAGRPVTRPGPVQEHFARAQFLEMSEEDRLTRPGFEAMDAGVEFSSAAFETSAAPVRSDLGYETRYLDLAAGQTRDGPGAGTAALDYDLIQGFARYGAAGRAPQRAADQMDAVRLPIAVSAPPVAAADRRTLHAVPLAGPPTTAQMIIEQRIRRAAAAGAQLVEAFELAGARP
jgi:hypothetical protein